MPYILNKTNGAVLATVQDAAANLTTNLTFVGRNYSGYGEIVNENFLKLLENFSNSENSPPSKPLQGQLWFNSTTKQLNVSYDGKAFKGIASLRSQSTPPLTNASSTGDIWWDVANKQLKVFDGAVYTLVGPSKSALASAYWSSDNINDTTSITRSIITAQVGTTSVAVVADNTFQTNNLGTSFTSIKKGITLPGANSVTGSSYNKETLEGYIFWGTAAESLNTVNATTATTANVATKVTVATSSTNVDHYVTFASGSSGDQGLKTDTDFKYNPSTNVLTATATAARYADLAERYAADAVYDEGTVLVVGGPKEVTVTHVRADLAVAGVVSKKPAYLMNTDAGTDETHPAIALKGRIPCKVTGKIYKGDPLVTAKGVPGYATAYNELMDNAASIFAIALEDNPGAGLGLIEVKV
jgi:hypothetical protein